MITPTKKAQLKWHCRRGMLELDLILMRFAEAQLDNLTDEQVNTFDKLLSCIDPELFSWLMGQEEPDDVELREFVEFIRLQDKLR